mgnify:CR=1 FL=1
MSKEIRELEENSKRIIENMRPQTIAQYHIKQWLDDNFYNGLCKVGVHRKGHSKGYGHCWRCHVCRI